jgi:hypothetical protein
LKSYTEKSDSGVSIIEQFVTQLLVQFIFSGVIVVSGVVVRLHVSSVTMVIIYRIKN